MYGFRGPTTLSGGLWGKKEELLVQNCNWFPSCLLVSRGAKEWEV